jgi:hypothetical protein
LFTDVRKSNKESLMILGWIFLLFVSEFGETTQACPGPVGPTYGVAGWRGNSFIEISGIPTYPDFAPLPGVRNVGFVDGSGLLLIS